MVQVSDLGSLARTDHGFEKTSSYTVLKARRETTFQDDQVTINYFIMVNIFLVLTFSLTSRTLRLISKKLAAAEFQRAYDSIDSINASSHHHHNELNSASAKSLKSLSNSSSAAAVAVAAAAAAVIGSGSSAAAAAGSSGLTGAPGDMMSIMSSNVSAASLLNNDSVLIDNRKVSHQLGAQMGCTYPSKGIIRTSNNNSSMKSKARRNKKITAAASKKVRKDTF